MANDIRLLQQDMIREALRDNRFYATMPEYTHLRALAAPALGSGGGCSGCAEKRREKPVMTRFMETTLVLAKGRASALCAYFGGTPLMVSGTDPRTGKFVQHVLKPQG